jgi:serine/threonine protein kinase/formylglycine-generating enzyme required for sulfatase activity
MDPERWRRVEAAFERVIDGPATERCAALDAACGGDVELRRDVEKLLAADAALEARDTARSQGVGGRAPAFAGLGTLTSLDLSARTRDEGEITGVGPYRILRAIGEGGMGVVYLAEQTTPIERRVALKLVRRGSDSEEVLARFQAERQALAILEHPAIARVLDAGSTSDGRPYFVMEYVDSGVPITTFCDERRLGVLDRLRLFRTVCDAIQHAHQKGIIHRDIKPSNVLVSERDGRPWVKVIDFGIAKAVGSDTDGRTLLTEPGRIIGTPAYMSPEQARAGATAIDTRSDVYSLGVLLFELLVGSRPFDENSADPYDVVAILTAIRERDAPRPSARLARLDAAAARTTTALRSTAWITLRRELRRDIDWIALRALAKDPSRRYQTAAELDADIGRHLRREPVLARAPSFSYRFGRFVSRHRWETATAAAAFVGILVLVIGSWIARERRAGERLDEGRARWRDFVILRSERESARSAWKRGSRLSPTWAPVWERAAEFEAHHAHSALVAKVEDAYNEAVLAFHAAREAVPPFSAIRAQALAELEEAYFERWKEASDAGEVALGPRFFEGLVRGAGAGVRASDLDRDVEITVETVPPGCELRIFRFETRDERLVPLPLDLEKVTLAIPPPLRVAKVFDGHETFLVGDLIHSVARRAGGLGSRLAVSVSTEGELARFARDVEADETIDVVVTRYGESRTLAWTPYPKAELDDVLFAGRWIDPRLQFGFLLAGLPLELGSRVQGRPLETPSAIRLPRGSYLLVARREGYADARLPLVTPRDEGRWNVRLAREGSVPPEYVWIPDGPAEIGGDPESYEGLERARVGVGGFAIARDELTFGQWLEFLNHESTLDRIERAIEGATSDEERETVRVRVRVPPRVAWDTPLIERLRPASSSVDLVPMFGRFPFLVWNDASKRYELESEIEDLDLDVPVCGASLFAALEYAEWLSARDGGRWRFRLPTDFEWEKAARGVDRRKFIWGDYPIYHLCRSKSGARPPGRRRVTGLAPIGISPADESIYGVMDLAGSVSEFVLTPPSMDVPELLRLVVIRGANWDATDPRDFHVATRNRVVPENHIRYVGVRLVAEIDDSMDR